MKRTLINATKIIYFGLKNMIQRKRREVSKFFFLIFFEFITVQIEQNIMPRGKGVELKLARRGKEIFEAKNTI